MMVTPGKEVVIVAGGGTIIPADMQVALEIAGAGSELVCTSQIDFGEVDVGVVSIACPAPDPAWRYHSRARGLVTVPGDVIVRLAIDDTCDTPDAAEAFDRIEPGQLWSLRVTDPALARAVWGPMLRIAPLCEIDACGAHVSAKMLQYAARANPNLVRLDICHARIDHLPHEVLALDRLQSLEVGHTAITETALRDMLPLLPSLRSLGIEYTPAVHDCQNQDWSPLSDRVLERVTAGGVHPEHRGLVNELLHCAPDLDATCQPCDIAASGTNLLFSVVKWRSIPQKRSVQASGINPAPGELASVMDAVNDQSQLRTLVLPDANLDAAAATVLATFPQLATLHVKSIDADVDLGALQRLEWLTVDECDLRSLEALSSASDAVRLNLGMNLTAEDEPQAIRHTISALPSIESLMVSFLPSQSHTNSEPAPEFTPDTLVAILEACESHGDLTQLYVQHWPREVGRAASDALDRLSNLRDLSIDGVCGHGVPAAIASLPNLRWLCANLAMNDQFGSLRLVAPQLRELWVTAPDLPLIASGKLANLRRLHVIGEQHPGCRCGGAPDANSEPVLELTGIATACPLLELVDINSTHAMPHRARGIEELSGLSKLRTLDLTSYPGSVSDIPASVIARLHHLHLPQCSLDDDDRRVVIGTGLSLRTLSGFADFDSAPYWEYSAAGVTDPEPGLSTDLWQIDCTPIDYASERVNVTSAEYEGLAELAESGEHEALQIRCEELLETLHPRLHRYGLCVCQTGWDREPDES